MAISDGQSVTKVTLYEGVIGGGLRVKGHISPYQVNVTKNTAFFRSSQIQVSEELKKEAEDLLNPSSPLTPPSTCRESVGLLTVEGEVVEVSHFLSDRNVMCKQM